MDHKSLIFCSAVLMKGSRAAHHRQLRPDLWSNILRTGTTADTDHKSPHAAPISALRCKFAADTYSGIPRELCAAGARGVAGADSAHNPPVKRPHCLSARPKGVPSHAEKGGGCVQIPAPSRTALICTQPRGFSVRIPVSVSELGWRQGGGRAWWCRRGSAERWGSSCFHPEKPKKLRSSTMRHCHTCVIAILSPYALGSRNLHLHAALRCAANA